MSSRDHAQTSGSALEVARSVLPVGVCLNSYKAARPYLTMIESAEYDYRVGHASTAYGLVGIYDQGSKGREAHSHTRLDFVHAGRTYHASWDRTFRDRFLATLAHRLAQAITTAARGSAEGVAASVDGQVPGRTK